MRMGNSSERYKSDVALKGNELVKRMNKNLNKLICLVQFEMI